MLTNAKLFIKKLIYIFINYLSLIMMTTAVILMSLVTTNSNAMSNIFALNYLKTQEKNKIKYIKNKQYENRRNLMINNKSNRHYFNNFNIAKDYKR